MASQKQRLVYAAGLTAALLLGGWAYWESLVPATHPDHDHGILNLDAGGRLPVTTRDGKTRNLVGRPGKVLILHFFSSTAPGVVAELGGLFRSQKALAGDAGVEFVLIAHEPDFPTLDAWLKSNGLEAPVPSSLVLDPSGLTTQKLNSKRPIETMFFNAEGKLSSQARGMLDWEIALAEHVLKAKSGEAIE